MLRHIGWDSFPSDKDRVKAEEDKKHFFMRCNAVTEGHIVLPELRRDEAVLSMAVSSIQPLRFYFVGDEVCVDDCRFQNNVIGVFHLFGWENGRFPQQIQIITSSSHGL